MTDNQDFLFINSLIRWAFAQGVSDHGPCASDIGPFHFFRFCFGTFAIEANSSSYSEQFFGTRAMETNSHNISRSSYCFLFEKCAREAASPGATGHDNSTLFSSSGPLFLMRFSEGFLFCKMVRNRFPSCIKI